MKLKFIITVLSLIAVATLFVACKPENKPFTEQSSGTVVFPDAGVALDVDNC
jgi:hypothetical protein